MMEFFAALFEALGSLGGRKQSETGPASTRVIELVVLLLIVFAFVAIMFVFILVR